MHIVTSFFMFHYRAVLHVNCHLFLYFTTKLYFMHIVTSFLYYTTQSCPSCTLSPVFLCFTTHRAVLHVNCHLFFIFHYT
jgi:hypothetical protein